VQQVQADLEAGSWRVICEARESGTVGIYHSNGEVKAGLIEELVAHVDVDRLCFEAPQKTQQAWLVQKVGSNANLGNIPTGDVIALETIRLGLRADTMGHLFDVESWNKSHRPAPAAQSATTAGRPRIR
jgi:phosphosulfolactate synthase